MTTTNHRGTPATDKQRDYILYLANRIKGTNHAYLSQVRDVIGLSSHQLQRGLTKAQASRIIDDLKARVS